MDMFEPGLAIHHRSGIAHVVIDRPERRNAMTRSMMTAVVGALEQFAADDDVLLVVFRGEGDVAFSSGADIKELGEPAALTVPVGDPMGGLNRNMFEAIIEFPKPTIAAINGFALGGGLELALACDIRIASEHAILGVPEAKRGLGANFATQMLPRIIPQGFAFEMLYTGRDVTATEALRLGLVNRVCESADLDDTVAEMAGAILANAPLSIRRYKAMITKGRDLPLAAALRLNVGPNPYVSSDRLEGAAAFRERRPPRWQGR